MAPYVPEEVDVFSIPHSRMKELVNAYVEMIKKTNFTSDLELKLLLESLLRTFMEFKMHEQIENQFIMKKLKNKLRALSIKNTAVCNCHSDDTLSEMMNFIEGGYRKKTEQDKLNFGMQLKQALEEFTDSFLPHMKEEEEDTFANWSRQFKTCLQKEVFQPLLLQYFSYEELRDLRLKVIQQHIKKEQIQLLKEQELAAAKKEKEARFAAKLLPKGEKADTDNKAEVAPKPETEEPCYISNLPPEIMIKIFSHLNPRDLGRCRQVNHEWSRLAVAPELWREVHPVHWAQGNWQFRHDDTSDDDDDDDVYDESDDDYNVIDDVTLDEGESEGEEEISESQQQVQREAELLTGLVKHVLPKAGKGVRRLDLKNSKTLTNGMLNKILQLCPNVEVLDVTQTKVSDLGLQWLGKFGVGSKLKRVVLSGCVNITDATLVRLAMAQHQSLKVKHHSFRDCPATRNQEHTTASENTVTLHNKPRRKYRNIDATNYDEKESATSVEVEYLNEEEFGFEEENVEGCCQYTNEGDYCEEIMKEFESMSPRDCLCEAYFNECHQSIEGGCGLKVTTTCRKARKPETRDKNTSGNAAKTGNDTKTGSDAKNAYINKDNAITRKVNNVTYWSNDKNGPYEKSIHAEQDRRPVDVYEIRDVSKNGGHHNYDVIKCCQDQNAGFKVSDGCCRAATMKKDPDSDLDLSAAATTQTWNRLSSFSSCGAKAAANYGEDAANFDGNAPANWDGNAFAKRYTYDNVALLVDMRERPESNEYRKSADAAFVKNRYHQSGEVAALGIGDNLDFTGDNARNYNQVSDNWETKPRDHMTSRQNGGQSGSGDCHVSCNGGDTMTQPYLEPDAIEDCIPKTLRGASTAERQSGMVVLDERTERLAFGLEYLNLSGCFQVTDVGLRVN